MESDKQRTTQWFLKNYGLVMSIAFSYAPSPDLASDIAQASYIELMQERIDSHENENLMALLRRVVRRVAQRHWDERQRTSPEKMERIARYLAMITGETTKDHPYEDELIALRECLSKLREKKHFLIEQHYFMKRTSRSIAEQLGLSRDAVANAIFRIRKSLKNCIGMTLERKHKG